MGSDRPLSQKEIDLLLQQIAGAQAKPSPVETSGEPGAKEGSSSLDAAPQPSPQLTPEERAWLLQVQVDVTISLGGTTMPLHEVLGLKTGSSVFLDRMVGDPVDILVGSLLVARGRLLVQDDQYVVEILEVPGRVSPS
ncbi:MAG: FliM/FliN family flagellar motor switch protein [Bacillota bacterium]|nr:FliM/FliN family flagellar motor switch protein [Bacillota bacterium]